MRSCRVRGRSARAALVVAVVAAFGPTVAATTAGAQEPARTTELSGTVVRVVAETMGGEESTMLSLRTRDRTLALTGRAARVLAPLVGSDVTVRAGTSASSMLSEVELVSVAGRARAAASTTTIRTGPRKVLVVTALWQGHRALTDILGNPIGADRVASELAQLEVFMRRASSGLTTLDITTVDEPIATGIDAGGCDGYAIERAVRNQLAARGTDPDAFDHLMILLPWTAGCLYGGLALWPGRTSWYNALVERNGFAHELGHNLGMHHGLEATCTSPTGQPVSISSTCSSRIPDRADGQDMMSSGPWTPFGYHREVAGWTTASEVRAGEQALLAPVGTRGAVPDLLRFRRPDGSYLYLDVRRAGASSDPVPDDPPAGLWTEGIAVRLVPSAGPGSPAMLLDAAPGTTEGFLDATLRPGMALTDSDSGVAIRNDGPDGLGHVRVSVVPRNSWRTPGPVTLRRDGSYRTTIEALAPADPAPTIDHFEMGESTGPSTTPVMALDRRVFSRSVPVGAVPEGRHWISVRAVGPDGSPGPWSPAIEVVGDTVPPTRPAPVTADAGPAGCRLTWSRSADATSGVDHYEVRTGTRTLVAAAGARSVVLARPAIPDREFVELSVVAVDAAGNRSQPATTWCRDTVAPTPPAGLRAAWTNRGEVRLYWRPPTDRVGKVSYIEITQRGSVLTRRPASATSVSVTLDPQGSPRFELLATAVDAAGNQSAPARITLADNAPPVRPSVRLGWRADGRLRISWTTSADRGAGVDRYLVLFEGNTLPAPGCCELVAITSWTRRAALSRSADYRRRLVSVAAVDRAGNVSAWTSVAAGSAR